MNQETVSLHSRIFHWILHLFPEKIVQPLDDYKRWHDWRVSDVAWH